MPSRQILFTIRQRLVHYSPTTGHDFTTTKIIPIKKVRPGCAEALDKPSQSVVVSLLRVSFPYHSIASAFMELGGRTITAGIFFHAFTHPRGSRELELARSLSMGIVPIERLRMTGRCSENKTCCEALPCHLIESAIDTFGVSQPKERDFRGHRWDRKQRVYSGGERLMHEGMTY